MNVPQNTLEGRLHGVTGKAAVGDVEIWFAYRTVEGAEHTATTRSNQAGEFAFEIPDDALAVARVGARLEGAQMVDLEAAGEVLEPGDVIIVVDDIIPSHLRHAGA